MLIRFHNLKTTFKENVVIVILVYVAQITWESVFNLKFLMDLLCFEKYSSAFRQFN